MFLFRTAIFSWEFKLFLILSDSASFQRWCFKAARAAILENERSIFFNEFSNRSHFLTRVVDNRTNITIIRYYIAKIVASDELSKLLIIPFFLKDAENAEINRLKK